MATETYLPIHQMKINETTLPAKYFVATRRLAAFFLQAGDTLSRQEQDAMIYGMIIGLDLRDSLLDERRMDEIRERLAEYMSADDEPTVDGNDTVEMACADCGCFTDIAELRKGLCQDCQPAPRR